MAILDDFGNPIPGQSVYQSSQGPIDIRAGTNIAELEALLRADAASKRVTYDPTDLNGVLRNAGYDVGITLDQAMANQRGIYDQRASNVPGQTHYIDQNSDEGRILMNQPGGPTGTGRDSNAFSASGPTGQAGLPREPYQAQRAQFGQANMNYNPVLGTQPPSGTPLDTATLARLVAFLKQNNPGSQPNELEALAEKLRRLGIL